MTIVGWRVHGRVIIHNRFRPKARHQQQLRILKFYMMIKIFMSQYAPTTIRQKLTGLPVVVYGEAATTGVRFITIPLEDFFYNFGLLGFYLFFFRLFLRVGRRRATTADAGAMVGAEGDSSDAVPEKRGS